MIGAGICKYYSKIQGHIELGRDATAFQAEIAVIRDWKTSCLKKKLAKEQIKVHIDNQVAVTAQEASGTKSLPVAGYIEKLIAL